MMQRRRGYLYAEMWLYQLERAHWSKRLGLFQKVLQKAEQQLVQLPAVAVISGYLPSTSPVDSGDIPVNLLPVIKCVWLLVGVDQLALRVLQGEHYGFYFRQQRDKVLKLAGYQVRHVTGWPCKLTGNKELTVAMFLDLNSETYQQASRYLGEIDRISFLSGRKLTCVIFTVFKKNNECYLYWVNYLIIRSCK